MCIVCVLYAYCIHIVYCVRIVCILPVCMSASTWAVVFVFYVYCMWIVCILYVYFMCIICILHVRTYVRMYVCMHVWMLFVYFVYNVTVSCTFCMYMACTLHVYFMYIVCIMYVDCMYIVCIWYVCIVCIWHVHCIHIACRYAYVCIYVNIWSSQRIKIIERMQRCLKRNPETKSDPVWGSGKHAGLPEEKPRNQEWPSVGKWKGCKAAWRESLKPRTTLCVAVLKRKMSFARIQGSHSHLPPRHPFLFLLRCKHCKSRQYWMFRIASPKDRGCILYAYCVYIVCILCVYGMYMVCVSCVYCMFVVRLFYVYYMFIVWLLHVYFIYGCIYVRLLFHVYCMYFVCILYVHRTQMSSHPRVIPREHMTSF